MIAQEREIFHPNREKPICRSTRSALVVLLTLTAALTLLLTFTGWDQLTSSRVLALLLAALYLALAARVWQWKRGSLPASAALGAVIGIVAAVAAPSWASRSGEEFSTGALGGDLMATLTFCLVPLQLLVIFAALYAFRQNWHVEAERSR